MKNTFFNWFEYPKLCLLLLIIYQSPVRGAGEEQNCRSSTIINFEKSTYHGDFQNWGIDIGSDNYVYVANNRGLLVYNGIDWESYIPEEITNLRSVAYDTTTHRIYTSGYREMGYWEWNSKGHLDYHSLTHLAESYFLENEEFWNVHFYNGKPVFHSFSGLFIFEDGAFRVIRTDGFISGITTLGSKLLLFIRNQGVFQLNEDELAPFLTGSFYSDKYLVAIFPWSENDYLLVTSKNGIYITNGEDFRSALPNQDRYFNTNSINRAHLLDSATVVIGTILDGIYLMKEGRITLKADQECGLINNTVLGIAGDTSVIWLALDRGISQVKLSNQSPLEFYTLPDIGTIYSGAVYRDQLYLGTNQGLYISDAEPPYSHFQLIPGTQGQIWDCTVFEDVLFVGHNSGTFLIDGDQIEWISDIAGGFNIKQVPMRRHSLLQSTYSYLAFYEKGRNGKWHKERTIPGFANLIRYLEFDQEGQIWASHMHKGIYRIWLDEEKDSVLKQTYLGANSVFHKDKGIQVFKIKGQIIFTTGDSLYTYDLIRDSIVPHDRYNQQLGAFAKSHRVVPFGEQKYWLISKDGVALYDFRYTEIVQLRFFPAPLFSGNIIDGYENIIPIDSHRALYCLTDGVALLDTEKSFNEKVDTTRGLLLKRLSIVNANGERSFYPREKSSFRIPPQTDRLIIELSYPSYVYRDLTYYYRIIGLNDEWVMADDPSAITLFRLPHGSYQIELTAEDLWKNRTTPLVLDLEIRPPWYLSSMALLLFVGMIIGLIFFVRYRSLISLRTREKQRMEENERSLTKLRNQNLRNELSLKSRELANSTMAIIKKNEFLFKLKEILKKQKAELGTRYPDKYYQSIVRKIDQNIAGGDDWRVFETNLEKAHELFLQKMIWSFPELTPSDLRLCAFLRMNLSSKEIAPLMRVSVRAVENHRYRLRKKLKLSREVTLSEYIIGIKV